ncbi:MAG: glutathione S-transferase family protein [Gammaproteobacteria bacterium]
MPDVILHHYPQSPVSEKVRVVFGIKDLAWRSVEIPRLPPKPDLMPLTGGYRRTPVMQIGADIYCDSQCIIREVERRFPEPTLYPNGADGMVWGISRWTDGPLFTQAIGVVFGSADKLPKDFAKDRGQLYFGARFSLKALRKKVPEYLAQVRTQVGWMDQRLAGRQFMLGNEPGVPDVSCYYLIWFIRGRYAEGPEFLEQFPHLLAWEERMKAFGNGRPKDMSAIEALEIAKEATAETPMEKDAGDPQDLTPGLAVGVAPDGDGGDPEVTGEIISVSAEEIAIRRTDGRVGEVVVHFPRVGYRVKTKSK